MLTIPRVIMGHTALLLAPRHFRHQEVTNQNARLVTHAHRQRRYRLPAKYLFPAIHFACNGVLPKSAVVGVL